MTADLAAAVIGGSGFTELLEPVETIVMDTPYGATSAAVTVCDVAGRPVALRYRHSMWRARWGAGLQR